MSKIDEAIAKITSEAMAVGHPYALFLEEHLTELCTTEAVAEKLLNPQKGLKKHVDDIIAEKRKEADKSRKGNIGSAGLSDEEAYRRVEEYYGIRPEDQKIATAPVPGVINLSDFLEV